MNAEFLERNRGEKSWLLLFYPFSSKVLAMLKSFTQTRNLLLGIKVLVVV